jgi:hypothetical protein
MKRRNFIIIGTAGIAAATLPTAFYFFRNVEFDPALADPKSLSLIWDTETITDIGNKYRLQIPSEKSERSLVKLLEAPGPDLEQIITKDFESENTVIIDGWILSKTEARQCALFSLTQPK